MKKLLIIGLSISISACAASHDYVSTIEPESRVSTLSDAAATDLCVDVFAYYDRRLGADAVGRAICVANAIATNATAETCQTALDACTPHSSSEDALRPRCAEEITAARSGCTATAMELERCVTDSGTLLEGVLTHTCAEAPSVSSTVGESPVSLDSPASCTSLPPQCVQLILQSSR